MKEDSSALNIKIQLHPKQKEVRKAALSTDYVHIGYGGARGGGKSRLVRDLAIEMSFRFRVPVLIFRRLRENLLKNHINPMLAEHPELRKYFNKSEFILYDPNTGEARITFGYAERDEDILKFQGSEYALIFIDEATQATKRQLDFLATTLRDSTGRFPRPKIIYTMNPGGVSHRYIKRIFIDKQYEEDEDPSEYYFVQAKVHDNVFWVLPRLRKEGYSIADYYSWSEEKRREYVLKYSDYAKVLARLPEDMRRAHLDGDWDAVEGQFFDFRRTIHVIPEKHYLDWWEIKQKYKLIGSLDYGNTTVLYITGINKNNQLITFDELYHYKMPRTAKIQETIDFLRFRGLEDLLIIGDTNMWIKDGFDTAELNTPAMEYIQAGIKLKPVSKISPTNKPYRVACNDTVRNLLDFEVDETGITKQPRWKVYERCSYLIETLPALTADFRNPDDINSEGEDHGYDAVKYGIMYLVAPKDRNAQKNRKPDGSGENREFKDVIKKYREKQKFKSKEYAFFLK